MIVETCPKCGAVLMNTVICTNPPIPCKDCPSCGWHWEREPESIEYRPFGGMDWRCRKMARAYRKKPVVVEAVQWTGENHAEMCEFIDQEVFEIKPKEGLIIHTLEGNHHASPGDYIIKGVNGEFYPCKPDIFAKTYEPATLTPPNEPLTCGLVDRHGAPLRAGDTVAADKFFVYAVRYGSHNVNPDNCAPAYQVGWYLEIMWAYPGFEDSVGRTEPLYDIDGVAARYPAHCADTTDGIDNLKFEKVTRRPPEGEVDGK